MSFEQLMGLYCFQYRERGKKKLSPFSHLFRRCFFSPSGTPMTRSLHLERRQRRRRRFWRFPFSAPAKEQSKKFLLTESKFIRETFIGMQNLHQFFFLMVTKKKPP